MKAIVLAVFLGIGNCNAPSQTPPLAFTATAEFDRYWNSGLAELARYELQQARYGSMHRGEMIAIFVTEPFRTDKQVKSELTPGKNDTNVLKVQTTRRFATGVYDYVLTTSVFEPLSMSGLAQALKISGSAVDWCGQSWLQLNLANNQYRVQSRSYFEELADEDYEIPGVRSEDEIWNLIRMHGDKLPQGELVLIPSMVSQRLRHRRANAQRATAELASDGKGSFEYRIRYASPDARHVAFVFENKFPYRISEFRETYLDGFGIPRELTTTARLKNSVRTAYWREHDPEHIKLRKNFGVKGFEQ